jgi:hypothetical protein
MTDTEILNYVEEHEVCVDYWHGMKRWTATRHFDLPCGCHYVTMGSAPSLRGAVAQSVEARVSQPHECDEEDEE